MDGYGTEILGSVAAVGSMLSLLPQVVKTWRSRSTKDISFGWLVLALVSMAMWIAYGVLLPAWAVVAANVVTAVMALILLVFKLRYG